MSQTFPDLSLIKQAHHRAEEELGGGFVDEKHAVGVQTGVTLECHEERPDTEVTSDSADIRSVDHAFEPTSNLVTEQISHGAERNDFSKDEPPIKPEEKVADPPVEIGMELGASLQKVLPIRKRAQIQSRKPLQIASHFVRVEKRIMEREDEELEAVVTRKTKRRVKVTTISAQAPIIVEEKTKTDQSNSSSEFAPSRFQKLS